MLTSWVGVLAHSVLVLHKSCMDESGGSSLAEGWTMVWHI